MALDAATTAEYLKVDNPTAGDLAEIESMLQAAIGMIERSTGYIFNQRTKTYYRQPDGVFRIYDTPINTDTSAMDPEDFGTFVCLDPEGGVKSLELDVGYALPGDAPDALQQAVLQMVKHFYYESETKAVYLALPPAIQAVIDNYRRFIL